MRNWNGSRSRSLNSTSSSNEALCWSDLLAPVTDPFVCIATQWLTSIRRNSSTAVDGFALRMGQNSNICRKLPKIMWLSSQVLFINRTSKTEQV